MKRKTQTKNRDEPSQFSQAPPKARPNAEDAPFAERLSLNLVVFSAGAVLMGLEIAGSRVLAPYFGNSVFVWGSLISVFLIAISLGNYIGGRVADQYPIRALLNVICSIVSLLIFAIALLARPLCQSLVGEGAGEQTGPLIASMVLFLPPSVGMGMISPFAIRLAAQSVHSIGKVAGTFYALSTMGSIAGTMLMTFVLIPMIGVAVILKGLGLTLLLVSIFTLPLRDIREHWARAIPMALVALVLLLWPGQPAYSLSPSDKIVVDVDSPYQHISVVDNSRRDSRELRFDHFIESAIRMTPPYVSLSDYTNYFHLAFLVNPEIRRTLFIGAGGGIGPRAFHMHDPEMAIDVVDIDAKVLEIARTQFFLESSPRIETIAQDGRMFLQNTDHQYDCIILDAFTIGGRIPFHLVTKEFLALCSERMTDDGVFIMNINSAIQGPSSRIFRSMYRTMGSVFPNTRVFANGYRSPGSNRSMNIILLADKHAVPLSAADWRARVAQYTSNSYVKRAQMKQIVAGLVVDPPDVSQAPMFTDDYAPIETMSF